MERSLETFGSSMGSAGDLSTTSDALRSVAGSTAGFRALALELVVLRVLTARRGGDAQLFGSLLAALGGAAGKSKSKGRKARNRRRGGADAAAEAEPATSFASVQEVADVLDVAAAHCLGKAVSPDSALSAAPPVVDGDGTAADRAAEAAIAAAQAGEEELDEDAIADIAHRARAQAADTGSDARWMKEAVQKIIEAGLLEASTIPGANLRELLIKLGMKGVPEPSARPAATLRVQAAVEEALASGAAGSAAVDAAATAAATVEDASATDAAWGVTKAVLKVRYCNTCLSPALLQLPSPDDAYFT